MESVLKDLNPVLQMLLVMSVFSMLPFFFTCMTSFLRYAIVFSMLKQALGTQQVPPGMVLVGLSIILTIYTMSPVFTKMWDMGSVPYQKNGDIVAAMAEGSKPLKEFMMKQTRQSDMTFFIQLSGAPKPKTPDDITIWQVAPAYIISELKTAFEIGFVIYVPFIVLDLVVANVLLALGMFMLSPTIISLPFKLLIFIAVDGWSMIVHGLVTSRCRSCCGYFAGRNTGSRTNNCCSAKDSCCVSCVNDYGYGIHQTLNKPFNRRISACFQPDSGSRQFCTFIKLPQIHKTL